MSRCLADRAVDHVVLERGQVANSWRTERWDSLRLLTPNWQSRLPGFGYDGDAPDGYRAVPEVVDFIDRYAVYPVAIAIMRERLLMLAGRFAWATKQQPWGPGRVDTPIDKRWEPTSRPTCCPARSTS